MSNPQRPRNDGSRQTGSRAHPTGTFQASTGSRFVPIVIQSDAQGRARSPSVVSISSDSDSSSPTLGFTVPGPIRGGRRVSPPPRPQQPAPVQRGRQRGAGVTAGPVTAPGQRIPNSSGPIPTPRTIRPSVQPISAGPIPPRNTRSSGQPARAQAPPPQPRRNAQPDPPQAPPPRTRRNAQPDQTQTPPPRPRRNAQPDLLSRSASPQLDDRQRNGPGIHRQRTPPPPSPGPAGPAPQSNRPGQTSTRAPPPPSGPVAAIPQGLPPVNPAILAGTRGFLPVYQGYPPAHPDLQPGPQGIPPVLQGFPVDQDLPPVRLNLPPVTPLPPVPQGLPADPTAADQHRFQQFASNLRNQGYVIQVNYVAGMTPRVVPAQLPNPLDQPLFPHPPHLYPLIIQPNHPQYQIAITDIGPHPGPGDAPRTLVRLYQRHLYPRARYDAMLFAEGDYFGITCEAREHTAVFSIPNRVFEEIWRDSATGDVCMLLREAESDNMEQWVQDLIATGEYDFLRDDQNQPQDDQLNDDEALFFNFDD